MEVHVVIAEPQVSGNVGAIARAMKNFDFKQLVLINPECDHQDYEGIARAMHAREDILPNAKVTGWEVLDEYDYVIGTTAMIGGDYNIKRSPVEPEDLGKRVAQLEGNAKVAVMFGREDQGLSNEEIMKCDFTVTIPTNPDYPTMNLSHSAAIILYELHKHSGREGIGEDIKPIQKKTKEVLTDLIDNVFDSLEFPNKHRRETNKLLWRRAVGRAMLTNREAQAMMGLFREVEKLIEKKENQD